MTDISDRIPQHRHCVYCGKAYTNGEGKFCSAECMETKGAEFKKTKKKLMAIWIGAIVLMVAAVILLKVVKP